MKKTPILWACSFALGTLLGCANVPTAYPHQCGVAPAAIADVGAEAKAIVARGFAPGVVVSIYCDGQAIMERAYGAADRETARPLDVQDLFRIYSMTKPITSFAALMLIDEGRLSLDDHVSRYLPAFADARVLAGVEADPLATVALERPITVRDLLRHTAGLTYRGKANAITRLYERRGIDHGGGAQVKPEDGSSSVTDLDDFVTRLAAIPLLNQPGARFSYGNATDVLAAVVEKAAGQSFRDFLRERLLRPLAMSDTFFDVPKEKLSRMTAAYSAPSSQAGRMPLLRRVLPPDSFIPTLSLADPPQSRVFAARRYIDFGGAGLVSTAADYQRFLHLLVNQGRHPAGKLARAETVALMFANALPDQALAAGELQRQGFGFGLGLAVVTDSKATGMKLPTGGAMWSGAASTYFWLDPDRKLSVVVLTQVFGGDVAPFYGRMIERLYASSL